MAALTEVTEAERIVSVLEVSRLVVQQKASVIDACETVGISPRQYYFWRQKTDAAQVFRQFYDETAQYSLQLGLAAQTLLMELLVADAVAPLTDVKDRLAIYKVISQQNKELIDTFGQAESEDEAAEFLKGPQVKKAPNKFSAELSEDADGITITTRVAKDPIIDITPPSHNSRQLPASLPDRLRSGEGTQEE